MKTAVYCFFLIPLLMLNLADRDGIVNDTVVPATERETEYGGTSAETGSRATCNREDNGTDSRSHRKNANRERFNEDANRFHSSLRETEQMLLRETSGN